MVLREGLSDKVQARVAAIYGVPSNDLADAILRMAEQYAAKIPLRQQQENGVTVLSERDVVLITYADQIRAGDRPPLAALHQFLQQERLGDCIDTVHLLPFFPYSSDDGFSVVDYLQVDPGLGDWSDVERLGNDFRLMFDLVLNHVSQKHEWFQKYLRGDDPFVRFFIDLDPRADVSSVTRPRSHPLLTPFRTSLGTQHVWTTFSADQVDLNYAEPGVLLRMLEVLLEYVRRGARIVRLDAVAYLWKEVGTSSIHLRQTHEVVKLFRDVVESVAPGALLLTETNVPHRENVSYFGEGDEAHMVYQFSLPPLLLDAFLQEDGSVFSNWLASLDPPPPGCAYFNFTASHDGIGVRPLEGLVSDARLARLIDHAKRNGGLVSSRRMPDGTERPYELNITYVDALAPTDCEDVASHARRFLASQGIMLALAGVPAVYFHSLVGTQNDATGAKESGQARRINRRKFDSTELKQRLERKDSLQQRIYRGYRRLLARRVRQTAFHPAASQAVVDVGDPQVIALRRTSLNGDQSILVTANLSQEPKEVVVPQKDAGMVTGDLLENADITGRNTVLLGPSGVAWLATDRNEARIG